MADKIKILFVDDDKNILDGLKRTLFSQKSVWDLFFATSGKEAIEIAYKINIDVIVSDMRMPIMNGAELLDYFQKNFPSTIRIILSGHSDHELILKTVKNSHQFLAKPINSEELISLINNCLKSREIINSKEMIEIINGIDNLPSLPNIYLEIENELSKEDISLLAIEKIIKKDIGLTAKILQVANSAYFASAVKTVDINSALNILGINVIKSLILFLFIHNFSRLEKVNEKYLEIIWEHSINTSNIAKLIVEEFKVSRIVSQELYSVSLLHDIGKLILLKNETYNNFLKLNNKLPSLEEENELFGFSHAHIGAYLLRIWNLPEIIIESVSSHHEKHDFNVNSLSSLLYYSNIIANKNFSLLNENEKTKQLFSKFNNTQIIN
ncbi:MAG: response regulator [Melioribacteraceae bacterium]|nr:response regulator [Melioribacteraceae bacterium]